MNPPSERLVAVAALALILAFLLMGCKGPFTMIDNSRTWHTYMHGTNDNINTVNLEKAFGGSEATASPTVKGVSYK